jgi:alanine racemase
LSAAAETKSSYNQWIEVDSSALAQNLSTFRRRVGDGVLLAPVVKSNAYGHGLERAARAFCSGGADWLCVHCLDEALSVAGLELGATILILGPLAPTEFDAAVGAGFHLSVSERAQLEALSAAADSVGRPSFVHLKVETGTHRQGIGLEDLGDFLTRVRDDAKLELVGMHSHFANIEDTTQHEFAAKQISTYERALTMAEELGCSVRVRHLGSSAAALLFDHTHYDMVRPGIAAYGYWPSRETLVSAQSAGVAVLELRPALCWKTRITQLRDVSAGSYVGYGCTERLERDTRLAVLPVGYADGYRRALSSAAHVLIAGQRCAVRGRVCMNLTMVDVGHVEGVALGDEVVLLGRQAEEEISAERMAQWAGTIHYEILAAMGGHIPRLPHCL